MHSVSTIFVTKRSARNRDRVREGEKEECEEEALKV